MNLEATVLKALKSRRFTVCLRKYSSLVDPKVLELLAFERLLQKCDHEPLPINYEKIVKALCICVEEIVPRELANQPLVKNYLARLDNFFTQNAITLDDSFNKHMPPEKSILLKVIKESVNYRLTPSEAPQSLVEGMVKTIMLQSLDKDIEYFRKFVDLNCSARTLVECKIVEAHDVRQELYLSCLNSCRIPVYAEQDLDYLTRECNTWQKRERRRQKLHLPTGQVGDYEITIDRIGILQDDKYSENTELTWGDQLTNMERRIIQLSFFQEKSVTKIASETKLSEYIVNKLLKGAISKLRQELSGNTNSKCIKFY